MVWSPLAGGLLTGIYLGEPPAAGAHLSPISWGAKHFTPQADAAAASRADCAALQGVTLTALSLAWTMQRPGVGSIVLGPRSTEQLAGQLVASEVRLYSETLERIDAIVPPGHVVVPYYFDDSFADFRPHPYRW
jgi:aryl-alcohol dehydrogenase-like predicted oxidoreductase